MPVDFDSYLSPFSWRYASPAMRALWSERGKRLLWRRIWLALAKVQSGYGLVSAEQLADLAAHPAKCTLAYWHHPLFTSGVHGPAPDVTPLWNVLYAVGAEGIINGHEHHYERFAPQTPTGALDEANGVREFIAGTGGAILRELPGELADNSQIAAIGYYGVLRFALYPESYSWQFISAPDGAILDEGWEKCH